MGSLERLQRAVELLKAQFADLVVRLPWLLIPTYPLPQEIWDPAVGEVAFKFSDHYPNQAPYAFYVRPVPVLRSGESPENTAMANDPPFEGGEWLKFSWQPDPWIVTPKPEHGGNLLGFVRSFRTRLEEGT